MDTGRAGASPEGGNRGGILTRLPLVVWAPLEMVAPEPLLVLGSRLGRAADGPCIASLRYLVRVEVADREQRQAEVADLGQQAVQRRLVDDSRRDRYGLAGLVLVPAIQVDKRLSGLARGS